MNLKEMTTTTWIIINSEFTDSLNRRLLLNLTSLLSETETKGRHLRACALVRTYLRQRLLDERAL